MEWHRIRPLTLLMLAFLPGAALANFQTGVAAYDRGDYAEAFNQWLPLAQHEDLAAQRNIAQLYRTGRGVPKDDAKAAYWYERAAEHGLASAQVNLAVLYLRGQGVPKDARKAADWFARAAQAGHAVAQYNLAMMYEAGLGVKRDEARAMGWYYLAARNGEPGALKRLGELVPFDPLNPPPIKGALPELQSALPTPAQRAAEIRAAKAAEPAPQQPVFGVVPQATSPRAGTNPPGPIPPASRPATARAR